MSKLVTKFKYLKPGRKKKAGGYAKYIGTREGVEIIDETHKDVPATRKQKEFITKLMEDYPECMEMIEYEDFQANPTVGNASEFITRAVEENMDDLQDTKTYADYIATRPRAQRFGAHGLFSDAGEQVILSKVSDELNHYEGNVWTVIISLRREDAERLGYDHGERWRDLLRAHTQEMSEQFHIPMEDLRWYAAFHDESHHPHCHLMVYSANPKEGYLSPGYAALLGEYARLYEHKTRILRDWREKPDLLDMLDDFSQSMCRVTAQLVRYRASYVTRLAEEAALVHADFSGGAETLGVEYRTVSTVTDPRASIQQVTEEIYAHQAAHRQAELDSMSCLTGAHKDDLYVTIGGRGAREFASQGQARTAALSLKLAEKEIFLAETGEYPVLLLDDVLSELDSRRRDFVLNRIGGGQTLITCCEDDEISEKTGGRVLFIENGNIKG